MNALLRKLRLLAVLGMMLGTVACTWDHDIAEGPLETETKKVKLGGAKSVEVEVQLGAGELELAGGAKDLLEGEFTYSVPKWKPEVDYDVSGTRGRLTIRQANSTRGSHGPGRNHWDLRLINNVPMDLRVELGAGKSNLVLGSLSLKNLELHMGVGEAVVDLTGDWKNDLRAEINGGVGKATVRLPPNVGVEVHATGGLGQISAGDFKKSGDAYVNDAFGKSPVTLRVNVSGGIGGIDLRLDGGPPAV